MTCVVGVCDELKGTVVMGADSAAVCEDEIILANNKKVFKNGAYLIGFAGSFRKGQVLQYEFIPPKPVYNVSPMKFMVCKFIPALIDTLAEFEDNEDDENDFELLVAYKNSLFCIDTEYQVIEYSCGYAAIGSASAYAMGSLFATNSDNPKNRVEIALSTAENFSKSVQRPFTILET